MLRITVTAMTVVTVCQHEEYQDPETKATKWNLAIIHFITHTCVFLTVICQNVHCEKGFRCVNIFDSMTTLICSAQFQLSIAFVKILRTKKVMLILNSACFV